MKVWQRVIIKVFIFLLVVAAAGGGVAGWRAYQQSTPEYTVNHYLTLLLDNSADKAYGLLDQSEEESLTAGEYASVAEAKKYGLYASYKVDELETRRDNDGHEYVDFKAEFMDADNEVQATEEFVVKKQSEATFGVFDKWKVMSSHCMVKDFLLTVPAGSTVYLNAAEADTSWISQEDGDPSKDCYKIPSILPGKVSLVVRHPALESVNTTLDTTEGSADFSDKMALKETAKSECLETGINALKQLYSGAVTEKTKNLDELLEGCMDDAKKFVKDQGADFNREGSVFKSAAISEFVPQYGDLTFTDGENGAITMEMTLSYHYVVQEDVTTDTEDYDEEGNPIQETNTDSNSGDNKAKFTMAFQDGGWHITAMDVPKIN